MATKSFSRDIIVSSSKALKLLRASVSNGDSQKERRISQKGSKTISDSQVKSILRDY